MLGEYSRKHIFFIFFINFGLIQYFLTAITIILRFMNNQVRFEDKKKMKS